MGLLTNQIRPSFHRRFTLVSFLGPNVGFLQTQKPLPPCRPLRRPHRHVLVVVIDKKLIPESGGPLHLVVVIVLEGQQPALEEKLVGAAHHGIVCDRKFEIRGRWRISGAPFLPGGGLLDIHKVVGEGDSWAHWSAVATLMLGVVHV